MPATGFSLLTATLFVVGVCELPLVRDVPVVAVLNIDDLSDAEVDGGDVLDGATVRDVTRGFLVGGGGGGIRRFEVVDDELDILASGGAGLRGGDEVMTCDVEIAFAGTFVFGLFGRSGSRGGIWGLAGGRLPNAKS